MVVDDVELVVVDNIGDDYDHYGHCPHCYNNLVIVLVGLDYEVGKVGIVDGERMKDLHYYRRSGGVYENDDHYGDRGDAYIHDDDVALEKENIVVRDLHHLNRKCSHPLLRLHHYNAGHHGIHALDFGSDAVVGMDLSHMDVVDETLLGNDVQTRNYFHSLDHENSVDSSPLANAVANVIHHSSDYIHDDGFLLSAI